MTLDNINSDFFQDWQVLTRRERLFDEGLTVALHRGMREELRKYGFQFYASNGKELEKDSLMYQRLVVLQFLRKKKSEVAGRTWQADHIRYLAREHFDHIRQIVSSASLDHAVLEQVTEWKSIFELYRSFQELRSHCERAQECTKNFFFKEWPMLQGVTNVELVSPLEPAESTLDRARMHQVLECVTGVLQQLIPTHVFILGPVPCELEFWHFPSELTWKVVYNIFSTEYNDRDTAMKIILETFKSIAEDIKELDPPFVVPPWIVKDAESLSRSREIGFRFHSMLVSLKHSKDRAERALQAHKKYIAALKKCDNNDPLVQVVSDLLSAAEASEHDHKWSFDFCKLVESFRKRCSPPSRMDQLVSLNEACRHFINGVVMCDGKHHIRLLVEAVAEDKKDTDVADLVTEWKPKPENLEQLSDKEVGKEIVAGETENKIRQVLATALLTLIDNFQKCAKTSLPRLLEVAEHEPCIPLPDNLQQAKGNPVRSTMFGECTIIDLGFRCDGSYAVVKNQGLFTVKFRKGVAGDSLDQAMRVVAEGQSKQLADTNPNEGRRTIDVVRLQGFKLINGMPSSITVVCRIGLANEPSAVTYEMFVDGQSISDTNPVRAVVATDSSETTASNTSDDSERGVSFMRIAQFVAGTQWRNENLSDGGRGKIADKAVQVAAAVGVEYRLAEEPSFADEFDVLNNVVYQSSKELLEHLPLLSKIIRSKWTSALDRNSHRGLAQCLDAMLQGEVRVLAVTSAELQLAKQILSELQYDVKNVQLDDLSFVAKMFDLEKRSSKPSISFVHLELVGHLEHDHVETICRRVHNSSLRLLVVASPSTQDFGKVKSVAQTSTAACAFRPSMPAPFVTLPFVASKFNDFSTCLKRVDAITQRVTKYFDGYVNDFASSVIKSASAHVLTIVCLRDVSDGTALSHRLADHPDVGPFFCDLSSGAAAERTLREKLKVQGRLVALTQLPLPNLTLFMSNERVVDAHVMFAPLPTPTIDSFFGCPVDSLSVEWKPVADMMVLHSKAGVDFSDFVAIVPECEWLDHRQRLQMYLLVVWGVPLDISAGAMCRVRNIASMPLQETLVTTAKAKGEEIESAPHYVELIAEGTRSLNDVLHTAVVGRVDLPWNICERTWAVSVPFSAAGLTQVLSVYPQRLRLLHALGPTLFHTLEGVDLFVDGVPRAWAAEVADRLDVASELTKKGFLSSTVRSTLSVVKWLLLSLGWNDQTDALDRFGNETVKVTLGAEDFIALDKEGIVMDMVATQSISPAHPSKHGKKSTMTEATTYNIALVLAQLEGSPSLFAKQPQVLEYFTRLPCRGGISRDNARKLIEQLLSEETTYLIGPPFLSVIKDASLLGSSELRQGENNKNIDCFWKWCNAGISSREFEEGGGNRVLNKLSCSAWAYLFATQGFNSTKTPDVLRYFKARPTNSKFGITMVLQEIVALSGDLPEAMNAATSLLLCDINIVQDQPCPANLVHIVEVLRDPMTVDYLALTKVRLSCSRGYRQFRVELESDKGELTRKLVQFPMFQLAIPSDFYEAVLFFGRCFSQAGRQTMLQNLTEMLLLGDGEAKSTLEIATGALWLHLPLAPCPLSVEASGALRRMKEFLQRDFTTSPVPLRGWSSADITTESLHAQQELQHVSNTFKYFVESEYEVVPYIALCLIGWYEYVPLAFLRALCRNEVIPKEDAPEECSLTIVVQCDPYPAYSLTHAARPLPALRLADVFKPQSIDINVKRPIGQPNVSNGVSSEIVRHNILLFAKGNEKKVRISIDKEKKIDDMEAAISQLVIVFWLKAVGFFVGCTTDHACREKLVGLVLATQQEKMIEAIDAFEKLRTNKKIQVNLSGNNAVIRNVAPPSFFDLRLNRRSSLLKFFDHDSLEAILYTVQTLCTPLSVLDESKLSRPTNLVHDALKYCFKGERYLANLVKLQPTDGEQVLQMHRTVLIVAYEIGWRLGQLWPRLQRGERFSYVQSVLSAPHSLLSDHDSDAQKMFVVIVDTALEQLKGSGGEKHRTEMCSAFVMAIGFQDEKPKKYFLYPLLQLIENGPNAPAANIEVIAKVRSRPHGAPLAFLTKTIAIEIYYWRDCLTDILDQTVATTLIPQFLDGGMEGLEAAIKYFTDHSAQFPHDALSDVLHNDSRSKRLVAEGKIEPFKCAQPNVRCHTAMPTPAEPQGHEVHNRFDLFRDNSQQCQRYRDESRSDDDDNDQNPPAPQPVPLLCNTARLSNSQVRTGGLHSVIIDVSAIIEIHIPDDGVLTGARLVVRRGLECALIRDDLQQFRIAPSKDIHTASTICCFFEDYGEAWDFCMRRTHRSTLVGRGFMLTTSPNGGWNILLGLDAECVSEDLRPWHILAFCQVWGVSLAGPAEDADLCEAGAFRLLLWICHRVCEGLDLEAETPQGVIRQLCCEQRREQAKEFCNILTKFIIAIVEEVVDHRHIVVEKLVMESAISSTFHKFEQVEKSLLAKCGVLVEDGITATNELTEVLCASLHDMASLGKVKPITGAMFALEAMQRVNLRHLALKKIFDTTYMTRNLKNRLREVLQREYDSNQLALQKLRELHGTETFRPDDGPCKLKETIFLDTPDNYVDDKDVGTGFQTGSREDVHFCVCRSYKPAELSFQEIERKEKYSQTLGMVVGFIVDKRLLELPEDEQATKVGQNPLVVQWILQVLRSPLPNVWKEWFLLHLRTEAVWMPHLEPLDIQHRIVAHLLAWRCEQGSVRKILVAAFGPLPSHCVRSNRIYGVIAMSNPPVKEWLYARYDVQECSINPRERRDEESFREIVGKFNPLTTHVVVHGYDLMSDTLLKWLCEYTFRYPWRFVVLANTDTTSNLPENRDRVSNLVPMRSRKREVITLQVDPDKIDRRRFVDALPKRSEKAFYTDRLCDWSESVELSLNKVHRSAPKAADRMLLIHLVSPPGGGKSTLMQELDKPPHKFIRFDCSGDRLVEEALYALLDEALAGLDLNKESVVLVADEYHMLPERKKEEFMQWAKRELHRVKIVMIANRTDKLDKKLLAELRATFPYAKENIRHIEGRISAKKVKVVVATYGLSTEVLVEQSRRFYTFLCTLRGLLGDDAVSLRLEEHFPRVEKKMKVNNFEFVKKLQDKLILFGPESVLRIINAYEQIAVAIDREVSDVPKNEQRNCIEKLYKEFLGGSPTKLLVFTAMLVPLLLYTDPNLDASDAVTECDRSLSYREVVEVMGSVRLAPVAVRLSMWVEYTLRYVGFDDIDMGAIFQNLQHLNVVDFPDFPIIEGESSLTFYPLNVQKATFVNYHDLTDLEWIQRTLSRRVAVNWKAIERVWGLTPVTDSDTLCTIIELAGSTTVFMAMSASNVLQLLKRNPTGSFRDEVVRWYPLSRIQEEMEEYASPYFFAAYTDLIASDPSADLSTWTDKFKSHVLHPRGGSKQDLIAKAFLQWISIHGSIVQFAAGKLKERAERVVEVVAIMAEELGISPEEHAKLWRGKYLAPVAEPFSEDGKRVLIPLTRAFQVAKGDGAFCKTHDKWPLLMRTLHRIVYDTKVLLTPREATELLSLNILSQPGVPGRLVGAILQADPPGWLGLEHQKSLLQCSVRVTDADFTHGEKFVFHARRNIARALREATELKIDCETLRMHFESLRFGKPQPQGMMMSVGK